ncbi:MAG: tRNA (adenosine(37)-N6)-threonylcarbamoyltransferase complex ATPase subunit type 1 TsaE [bacterium]|nr:tRNA (adenosine(37)-N6)-threonylcarbamoyltransferase complex ATPase subunit type 1 TsaE [bacterium]
MKSFKFYSNSPQETKKIARRIFKLLRPNSIVFLKGKMGSGKTTLIKGITKKATSGFFILHEILKKNSKNIHHFDFYRLKNPAKEFQEIYDYVKKAYIFIEWPKNIGIKPDAIINLKITGKRSRIIECKLL